MRRFALYSDIHGNLPALEAVYGDLDSCGVTERYCLGDLVGYGSQPSEVITAVQASGDTVIAGNYDDGVGARRGGCGCYYATPEAQAAGEESFSRTDAALNDAEHDYLASLPHEVRFEAEGLRVLLTHGSPRRINEYLLLDRPDSNLAKLAEMAEADVICVGHVHVPYHRQVQLSDGRVAHFVSDGSVGKPKDGDPRACWAEVTLEDGAVEVQFHRVAHEGEVLA